MNVLIIGSEARSEELLVTLADVDDLVLSTDESSSITFDVLFDTSFDSEAPLDWPSEFSGTVVVSSVNKTVSNSRASLPLIGMNMIPTFINRSVKEWSFATDVSREAGKQLAENLGWQFREVKDQIGMVTPRILFQIINEACFTLEEGTASIEDIDSAMKLGTNYPYGPFEWADRMGLQEIVATLEALSNVDFKRYQLCDLLRDKCSRGETFHSKT